MSFVLAHAAPISYRHPLPVWLALLAGGLAVVLATVVKLRERRSVDVYPFVRRLRLGPIVTVVGSVLIAIAFAGGLLGNGIEWTQFYENPMTVLTWIDFWVGLGIVSALVGNVWDFVSPLSTLGRALDRRLAARGASVLPYPPRLGVWPAVALLLLWTWLELVWDPAKEPRTLVLLALAYFVAQLAAMALFGTEVWLARGELFTVFARTLARFAPLELYVGAPAGPCRASRCRDDERIGCPACWLEAEPVQRGLRVRAYGSGVEREPPLGAGGGTFVLAALATVVYDGFSQTDLFAADVQGFFLERSSWLGLHIDVLDTILLVGIVACFALLFYAVAAIVSLREPGSAGDAARRYAPTLIPISAVYFVSHYFLYLVYTGQLTLAVILDPLEREWVPDYAIWTGLPGALVWYLQVGLIVWGHVVAVFAAHKVVAADRDRGPLDALIAQLPLVLLMVAYTFVGLWVLGQALTPR